MRYLECVLLREFEKYTCFVFGSGALGLNPSVLQEVALLGWESLDHATPPLGCTFTATLLQGEVNVGATQVTLALISNQPMTEAGHNEGVQVWRACLDAISAEAPPGKTTPPCCIMWVVSTLTLPIATSSSLDSATLELLPSPSPNKQLLQSDRTEKAGCARKALLNGHKAAVWIAGAPQFGGPSFILQELLAHQGPPPCFVFSVHVLECHLKKALRELHPSVSAQDLRRYERMRDQYAVKID